MSSCVLHNLAFPELSTGSVHFASDENGTPSEQTNLYCFCQSMRFLIFLFGELTKINAYNYHYLLNIKAI